MTEPKASFFRNPSIYHDVNSEAQKRSSTDVNVPAITWHMVFQIPHRLRTSLLVQLDNLAMMIISSLGIKEASSVQPSHEGRMAFFTKLLRFADDGQSPLTFTDITSTATAREKRLLGIDGKPPPDERSLSFTFQLAVADFGSKEVTVIIKKFMNMYTITTFASGPMLPDGMTKSAFKKQTVDYWESFSNFLFQTNPDIRKGFRRYVFRYVFADVRGVIFDKDVHSFGGFQPSPSGDGPAWADSKLMGVLRPLVTNDDRHECSASYMLDGRALYLTALGPQEIDYPDDKRLPLTFILCTQTGNGMSDHNVGPRQLGRLIDRMHLIEMLRHAALLDLPRLWQASRSLAGIDTIMADARSFVEALDNPSSAAASSTRNQGTNSVERARQTLNLITMSFLKQNVAKVGLSLRIENSRYYVSQYNLHILALRLRRVEGYRQYDEFVQRRLGATFEFVHRLGIRYERTTKVMASIDQSLATALSRKTGEELTSLGSSIEEIQRYGELILLSILVPYYVVGNIIHVLENKNIAQRVFLITAFLAVSQFAIGRFVSADKKQTNTEKSEALAKYAAGLLVSWFVLISMAIFDLYYSPLRKTGEKVQHLDEEALDNYTTSVFFLGMSLVVFYVVYTRLPKNLFGSFIEIFKIHAKENLKAVVRIITATRHILNTAKRELRLHFYLIVNTIIILAGLLAVFAILHARAWLGLARH